MSERSLVPDASEPPGARSGEYVVVARRYRPQRFDELVGQEHIGRALSNAIQAGRVGHAYLFTGARGVGKTSAARIFAKSLNCVNGPTPEPCNRCDICQSISSGDDVDVLEIDGASNRGIDEMRELRQNVNVRPSRARFKIYIIDEVHMLTREAFNALLKTLEEPPEHVKFIFCTTEPEKIPITILSRCQRFDFAGIEAPSIIERLRQIVVAEGVEADDEALASLARRAAGSMRDSQSLLEQLLAFCGPRITLAAVHRMLGTAADHRLGYLVEQMAAHDAAAALNALDEALAEGVDVGQLLVQLLGYYRDLMLAAVGASPDMLSAVSAQERELIQNVGQRLGLETILASMQILDHTLGRLRFSTQGRTLAELTLVRIARLEELDALGELIAELRDAPPQASPRPAASRSGHSAPPARTAEDVKKNVAEPPSPITRSDVSSATANRPNDGATESEADSTVSSGAADLDPAQAEPLWQAALRDLPDLVAAQAACCESVAITAPNRLVARFPAQYTSCKSFCERPDRLDKIEKALSQVAGRTMRVEFVVDAAPAAPAAPTAPLQRAAPSRAQLMENPMVRRAVELFDARPVWVDDGEA